MKRMKIGINFHTYDNYISGVDYYTLGLIRGLLSIDDSNEYVIYTNRPKLFEGQVNEFPNITIDVVDCLKSRIKRIYWEHFVLPWIAKRDKLDVLHCPVYIIPLVKVGIPYVVTIHDLFALENSQWCKWSNRLNYGLFMPRSCIKADQVIAVSQQTCRKLLQRWQSIDPVVIYPGVDKEFTPDENCDEDQKVKEKYQLPNRYLLYVGNIEPKKNLMALLRAYQVLRSKGLSHKLVLVGKRTWGQNEVWDFIQANFSADEIIMAGYADRKDLPGIYRQADVFVFPSFDEGFGFPVLEAMRCGVPVVASSVGILKEFPKEAYCKIDPCEISNIAMSIDSMIGDNINKTKQIERAQKESQRFSWQQCARETLKIYEKVSA